MMTGVGQFTILLQIQYIINRYCYCRLFTSLFLASMPIVVNAKPLKYAVRNLNYSNWIYEEYRNRRLCVRNITNMFRNRVIGSRPMYRDDVLYDGNISLLLMANIKVVFGTKTYNIPLYHIQINSFYYNRCDIQEI